MKTKLPERPARFAQQYPEIWSSFERLASQCHEAGPLDGRVRRLVKLGIALGAGLQGSVHAQVRNGLAEGISPEELRHVVLLGLTTIGFPSSMAALTWVNDIAGTSGSGTRKKRRRTA